MPLWVGSFLRALVDQFGEGLPLLPWEALQEGNHRLQDLQSWPRA